MIRALEAHPLVGVTESAGEPGSYGEVCARAVFFGRQGRFGDSGYEAQLNRASALSLVINAITVWNTRYLAAAADELARQGRPVAEGVWTHLSPLLWEHIHLVGQYRFDEPAISEGLRPLRAPEDDRKSLGLEF